MSATVVHKLDIDHLRKQPTMQSDDGAAGAAGDRAHTVAVPDHMRTAGATPARDGFATPAQVRTAQRMLLERGHGILQCTPAMATAFGSPREGDSYFWLRGLDSEGISDLIRDLADMPTERDC